MSFKAYLMRISNPAQAEILQNYLQEMQGVGYFNHALRVNKKTAPFEANDIVAAITVDRGDLSESFVDETNVCAHNEVPYPYARLEALNVDNEGTIEGMTIDLSINLKNLSHERTFKEQVGWKYLEAK